MKIKSLSRFGLSFVLSLSTLLGLTAPKVFAAGPFTCTWTAGGNGTDFSDAANWSGCNSAAPQPADNDNLVFPVTVASASPLNNDLTSAVFSTITVNGTVANAANEHDYEIDGNAFSISGGIINTAQDGLASNAPMSLIVTAHMTLTANQEFQNVVVTPSGSDPSPTFNIGSHTVTFSGGNLNADYSTLYSPLVGTGTLAVTNGPLQLNASLTNFSGNIQIKSNGLLDVVSAQLSSGFGGVTGITVDSGGTLYFDSPGTKTMAVPITISGSGANIGSTQYAALFVDGSGTLTLSGLVTLGSNIQALLTGANLTLTQAPAGGFTLSRATGSTGTLTVPAGSSSGGSSGGTHAPGTPDTGLAAITANPLIALVATLVASAALIVAARRLNLAKH